MLEGFKINCFPLNRAIRISIALPKDYNNTSRYYPVIYFMDGQNLYKDEDSYRGMALDLEETITRLSLEGKEAIYVGIAAASNPERRDLEYEDKTLAEFILSSIHPYLKTRYRMNQYIYAFACSKASYTALLLNENYIFKGFILISPDINTEKIKEIQLPKNNLAYIAVGSREQNGLCLSNALALKEHNPDIFIQEFDNQEHTEAAWKTQIYDALSYLVL